jgi:hypothetical protein
MEELSHICVVGKRSIKQELIVGKTEADPPVGSWYYGGLT